MDDPRLKITVIQNTEEGGPKTKTLRVRVLRETSSLMYAEELDPEWMPKGVQNDEGNWVHTEHLISTDLITKRVEYVQSLHYGGYIPKHSRCERCGIKLTYEHWEANGVEHEGYVGDDGWGVMCGTEGTHVG